MLSGLGAVNGVSVGAMWRMFDEKLLKKGLKFCELRKSLYICTPNEQNGLMAEWLGTALQKLLQRFESASDLKKVRYTMV